MRAATLCLLLWFVSISAFVHAEDLKSVLDVPYGADELQKLDVYMPKQASGAKRPAVLWIHGGGWTKEDKRVGSNGIGGLANVLVARGYVAFACNYRLAPKSVHPAQIDDVQRAVRFIRAHADEYGVDPEHIGAVGISAGGHLTALLAVRTSHAKQGDELDKFSSQVQAGVALCAPTDVRDNEANPTVFKAATRQFTNNDAKLAADASPIMHVSKQAAPLLLITGDKDPLVPYEQSTRMQEKLKASGATSELLIIPGAGHAIFPTLVPKVRDAMSDFFAKHLQSGR